MTLAWRRVVVVCAVLALASGVSACRVLERGAQAVNGELAGSVLLTRDGYGSLSYFRSACVKLAVDAYVTRTALPPGGTVCESDYPA